jgi:hypothetical protein
MITYKDEFSYQNCVDIPKNKFEEITESRSVSILNN